MYRYLNYERVLNGFYKFLYLILISIFWLAFCIPIFTSGASTAAMYYAVQKCVRHDRGRVWKSFWKSFRENFKQATIVTLVLLAVTVVLVFAILYVETLVDAEVMPTGYLVALRLILLLLCIYAAWIFFHMARFEGTVGKHLENALLFAVFHLPMTIAMTIIGIGSVILIQFFIPLILIVPGTSVLVMGIFSERVFRKYMSDEDKAMEDELNQEYLNEYAGKKREERKKQRRVKVHKKSN